MSRQPVVTIRVWARHNRPVGQVASQVAWDPRPADAVQDVRIHATLPALKDATILQKRIHALLAAQDVHRTVLTHAIIPRLPQDAVGVRPCARGVALRVAKGAENHV